MATVTLRAPLRDGTAQHQVSGATVGEAVRELEGRYPRVVGWILDEHGRVRPHVNVFVNGERRREDAPLAPDDMVQILPSISGGSA